MALIRKAAAYSRLTVTLPTALIIAIRQMVKDSNGVNQSSQPLTLSSFIELWLFSGIRKSDFEDIALKASSFKRAAEAWIRWEAQQRARRKPDLRAKRVKP